MQAQHPQNIILRKRKIKNEPLDSLDSAFIISEVNQIGQGHEVLKRQKMTEKPSPSRTSGAPIRCGQCTFSHTDPNEVERHRN